MNACCVCGVLDLASGGEALRADQGLQRIVAVAGLDPPGFGGRFGLQVAAAVARRLSAPVLEIGVGTALAGAHRGPVDRDLEALG
jgi:hypothetical protein